MEALEDAGVAMRSAVVSFRIDLDSPAGKVYEQWINAGYKPRQVVESGLVCLDGISPDPAPTLGKTALDKLQDVVQRLETVVDGIRQNGGVMTQAQHQEVADMLDEDFVQGMEQIVRPGFTMKPED